VRVLPVSDPRILRELAALLEEREPNRAGSTQARRSLDLDSLKELADMLGAGKHPTIGWWRRHLPPERAARLGWLEARGSEPLTERDPTQ
jgi:hypothetical protein